MKKLFTAGILLLAVLLMLSTGCERKVINEGDGGLIADATACFACHSDQNFDLVAAEEQWKGSKHASGDNIDRNRLNSSFYASCEACHTSEGFVASLSDETASGEYFTAIGCFTCHQPHTNGTLELRTANSVTLLDGEVYDKGKSNICASCHHSRANINELIATGDVTLSLRWGPHHSNHADMLLGTNGYEYADADYSSGPHTNATINGCNDCHMSASGDYTLGGHSWGMYDEDKEHYNLTGCNSANCHNDELDDFDYEGVQTEVEELLAELETILEDAGMLSDEHPTDLTVSADSAGAVFNYLFVHEDRSHGVHNPKYTIGLLKSAINFMETGDPSYED